MISEGQLKRYCSGDGKDIENYEEAIADTSQKWVIHHRLELTEDGDFQYSVKDLRELGLYNKRPSEELIFLTNSEHNKLHAKGKSDEHREKISKANKGIPRKPFTAEHRANMSKAHKGKKYTTEHCENLSKAHNGKYWYNNGIENKRAYDCPDGFVKGRLTNWQ